MIMMLAKLQRTFHDTALGGTDEIHDFVGREEFNFGNHKVTNFTVLIPLAKIPQRFPGHD